MLGASLADTFGARTEPNRLTASASAVAVALETTMVATATFPLALAVPPMLLVMLGSAVAWMAATTRPALETAMARPVAAALRSTFVITVTSVAGPVTLPRLV